MKLTAVDRRCRPGDPDPWAGAREAWSRLETVVSGMGPAGWALELVLVDDGAMADLNRRWRGGDGVTDVLSFTYLEPEGNGPPDLAAGNEGAARDLWLPPEMALDFGADVCSDGEMPLVAEVVLAPAFVAGRCREQGWDTDLEWPLLLVHGCLHVLGWEHDDTDRRRAMADREAEHLARVGLPHPLRERS